MSCTILGLGLLAVLLLSASPPSPSTAASGTATTTTTTVPPSSITDGIGGLYPAGVAACHAIDLPSHSTVSRGSSSGTSTSRTDSTRPCTILVIGDSLGTDLGEGLTFELSTQPHVRVISAGIPDTGLSNSWYYSWPKHLAKYIRTTRPDLVVVFLGGNDERAVTVNGARYEFGSSGWKQVYASRVNKIVDVATDKHVAVLWVGMPIMGPNGYRQGIQTVNSVTQKATTDVAGVAYFATWGFFSSPSGQFRSSAHVNGSYVAIRTGDGIHLTPVGGDVLATALIAQMRVTFHLNLSPRAPVVFTK